MSSRRLSDDGVRNGDSALSDWLQLTLTPGLGGTAIRQLLGRFGLPKNVLARKAGELAALVPVHVIEALHSESVHQAVERAMVWASTAGHFVITLADEAYPRQLLEIPDPPTLIYAAGRIELLRREILAMVGSRNATPQGEANAASFAKAFSEAGITIVSGLAMGIDAAAHRGALAGPGSTIAILGTGVDIVYPRRNAELADQIRDRGLLVSEFALGTAPAAHNFPRRNRLISGLSRGCLVVEAAASSGSLITARTAADQGRDVFALPGSIHSPLSKGCHALIKTGAKLVESAEDVLGEFSGFRPSGYASTALSDTPAAVDGTRLLGHMGHDPVDVDSLCTRAGMSAEQVSSELLRLELEGRVTALPGGLYQRLEKGGRG